MSVGDHIKAASEGASHLTQRVVDAVERRVNDATTAVESATGTTGEKIREIIGRSGKEEEAARAAADDRSDRDATEHWADDGGETLTAPRDRSLKPKHIAGQHPERG
ncbi:hypothetical protein [Microbacterium sp. NPDC091676]|uniref:hypothetical protein n=1 Tax=Microbacterium sp. NPDC091676 TaxID=3364212 RepID=UPI003815880D